MTLQRSTPAIQVTHRSGFTLIESLLYMGLLTIFMLVLTDILVSILQVRLQSPATNRVEQDAQYVLARLTYDIRRATSVTTPATPGVTSSQLVLVIGGQTYTYASQSGSLVLTTPAGTSKIMNMDTALSAFTVTRIGNGTGKDTFQIKATIDSTSKQGTRALDSTTLQTTIGQR